VPGRARHRVSSIECQELDIAGSEVLHKSPECVQGVQVGPSFPSGSKCTSGVQGRSNVSDTIKVK
jgi:hypothetical protein